jgi:group I intron endonuclease
MLVYLITNEATGKLYVGQTKQSMTRRLTEHRSNAKHGRRCALHAAINKYGREKFSITELHRCESKEEMDFTEMFYIALLGTKSPFGYNLTDGGEPVFDCTGRKLTSEHIAAIRRGTVGCKHPPRTAEWRRKQRESHLGQKATPEAIASRAAGLRRAWADGRMTGTRGKTWHRRKSS